jgi:zinc resistance-associated protein
MKQHLIAAAAFAFLAAPLAARAEPHDAGQAPQGYSAEDASAFTDARIAGLKAGLKLTPEQEKNWPQLEAAIRDNAKVDAARRMERREQAHDLALREHDAIAALHRHAQALSARSAEVEKLAQAATPLYASLDPAQKRRFGAMLRHAAEERMRHAMTEGGFGGPHPDHDAH